MTIYRPFGQFNSDVNQFISENRNFSHTITTNSAQILCKEYNFKCIYSDNIIPTYILSYFQNVFKKEMALQAEHFKKLIGNGQFLYNHTNKYYDFEANDTKYIDIKAAYLTILYNTGKLKDSTFEKIMNLEKKYRLVLLGMLASEPETFFYENGKYSHNTAKKSETKEIFFYCVKKTSDLMKQCVHALGSDFAFFWTDGIFFKNTERNCEIVRTIFDNECLKYKEETTEIVSVLREENGIKLEIKYKGQPKAKCFYLPNRDNEEKRIFRAQMRLLVQEKRDREIFEELAKHFILNEKGEVLF
jgi:hypothetical protein